MFKIGDIVYCKDSDDFPIKNTYLELDTPYLINNIDYYILELGGVSAGYLKERFISEKEYNISKRTDKINKIKNKTYEKLK